MLGEDLSILGNIADPGAGDGMWFSPLKLRARNAYASAPWRRQAGERLQRSGLAGAIAPKQRRGLTLEDGNAKAKQDLARAVVDVDALRF